MDKELLYVIHKARLPSGVSPSAAQAVSATGLPVDCRDLLDANESTWAFTTVDAVGCVKYLLVRQLATLAREAG